MTKIKSFTLKEKNVFVGTQEGKFFNADDYNREAELFKKEANTEIVDWYLAGTKGDKVRLTLVNYKRED